MAGLAMTHSDAGLAEHIAAYRPVRHFGAIRGRRPGDAPVKPSTRHSAPAITPTTSHPADVRNSQLKRAGLSLLRRTRRNRTPRVAGAWSRIRESHICQSQTGQERVRRHPLTCASPARRGRTEVPLWRAATQSSSAEIHETCCQMPSAHGIIRVISRDAPLGANAQTGVVMGDAFWQGPFGIVLLGLVAIAIAALVRPFRNPAIKALRQLPLPRVVRRWLGRSADGLFSGWRQAGGALRKPSTLGDRIAWSRRMRELRVSVIGGVYLDIELGPVRTATLTGTEFSDLEGVRRRCGGSAPFVAEYLWANFKQRSSLFSRIGRRDPFSREIRHAVDHAQWSLNSVLVRSNDSDAALSVHLLQHNRGFHTTFTSKGALADFNWSQVIRRLRRRTRYGGILYIGGYFRTHLSHDLGRNLEALSPNLVVIVDHGRFEPDVSRDQAHALSQAFNRGAVDVYIATWGEVQAFLTACGHPSKQGQTREYVLREAKAAGLLPRVTVVRDEVPSRKASCQVLLDARFFEPAIDNESPQGTPIIGPKNAFTAGFIRGLGVGAPEATLESSIRAAAETGLSTWTSSPSV